jgi:molybdopterin/thiamine biosynthesis adenylyltransferase
LTVPAVDLVIPGLPWHGSLAAVAEELATWAGAPATDRRPSTGVHVGGHHDGGFVLAQGDDWTAYVDQPGAMVTDGTLALGAVTAAQLAAARAFHLAIGQELRLPAISREPTHFSLRYGAPQSATDRPRGITAFTLVGAGAVGNALLWALAVGGARVAGKIEIVDPQSVDATNLNRHLLAGVAALGRPKAEVARDFIIPFARADALVERFTPSITPPHSLVCTVDNDEARYQAQATFPRALFHAATGGEHVSVGVLDFADGACLGCLFPRPSRSHAELIAGESGLDLGLVAKVLDEEGPVSDEMLVPIAERLKVGVDTLQHLVGRSLREVYARELCGRLSMSTQLGGPTATIAYVSGLAGTLLAAELAKDSDPALAPARLHNYVQLAATAADSAWVTFREKQDDCPLMCGSEALQAVVRTLRADAIQMTHPGDT